LVSIILFFPTILTIKRDFYWAFFFRKFG